MAKCLVCNSRKGKRKCLRENGMVCSQCCGDTRQPEHCQKCEFYPEQGAVGPVRRYTDIPRFSTMKMEEDFELQRYADCMESTFCQWDVSNRLSLNDQSAIKLIEMLLDKYHYHDSEVSYPDSKLLRAGFDMVVDSISEDIPHVPEEILVKILAVLRFVARRRSSGGREYFDVIQKHVGSRVGPGRKVSLLPKT